MIALRLSRECVNAGGEGPDGCGGSPPRYIMSMNSGNAFLLSSSFSVRFLRKYVLPILSLQVLACVGFHGCPVIWTTCSWSAIKKSHLGLTWAC